MGGLVSILAALVPDLPSREEDRLSLKCECFLSDLSVTVLVDREGAFISVMEVGGEGEVRSTAESTPTISLWVDPIDGSGLKRCRIQYIYTCTRIAQIQLIILKFAASFIPVPDKERMFLMRVLACSLYSSQMEV